VTIRVLFDPEVTVGAIDRRVFGSFVEHMGRSVYEVILEPDSPQADEVGLRRDVIDLVRELGVTIVRYPGGNFLSGYDWTDGVGPRAAREPRLDLAWHSLETNQFGTDEFLAWCTKAGVEPMLAVNLGSGTLGSAVELLEYCNVQAPSRFARQRAANGHAEPYGVRTWCLGNEMDGPWQIGHQSADEYGRKAVEVANAMRLVDPGIKLVACGSSGRYMPTFGAWEDRVLEHTYDQVDYISLHQYYDPYEGGSHDPQSPRHGDTASFLASGAHLESFITEVVATTDAVKARKRSAKTINLSLDEWNVWSMSRFHAQPARSTWDVAPRLIEDTYTVADAVVVGDLLISILRHADRVQMACQAQLVNVIAPIRAEVGAPAWRQTIFHPFALTARHAQATALVTTVIGPGLTTAAHGEVAQVSAVATHDPNSGAVAVFLVNRSPDADAEVELHPRGGPAGPGVQRTGPGGEPAITHTAVFDDDLMAVNQQSAPDRVVPRAVPVLANQDGVVQLRLPRASWNVVRIG